MRLPLGIATMATIATVGTVACASQPPEAELHAEALNRGPGSGALARVVVEGQPLGAITGTSSASPRLPADGFP
jgi:hypothetical protein